METDRPSLAREAAGFALGGILAATASGLAFTLIFPLPETNDPRNHTGTAFALTVLVMLFCGGFVGRRGFNADWISDLLSSIGTTLGVVLFLSLLAGLSFSEIGPLVGFALVGCVASGLGTFFLGQRFPAKSPSKDG